MNKYDVQYPLTMLQALDSTIEQVERNGVSRADMHAEAYYIDINGDKITRKAGWGNMSTIFFKKRLGYLKALREVVAELEASERNSNAAGGESRLAMEESRQQQD